MQPETKTPPVLEKELTPAEQWDELAFAFIRRELAPDGFKKVSTGAHKGMVIAKSAGPGTTQQQVSYCQKGTAQLIRSFREILREQMARNLEDLQKQIIDTEHAISKCKFWEWGVKDVLNAALCGLEGQVKATQSAIAVLDDQGPYNRKPKRK